MDNNTTITGEAGAITPAAEEKTFTQDDVNRIVSERLAKEKVRNDTSLAEREQALAQREAELQQQKEAVELEQRLDKVRGDRKFTHEYVRQGVLADFQKALADEANKGKSDVEVFDALTKDKDGQPILGIFETPPPKHKLVIPPPGNVSSDWRVDFATDTIRTGMGLPKKGY